MSALNNVDRNIKILVVDDYSTMRRIVRNCLKQLGFENVDEAEDGQAALGKLHGDPEFKFVISDWNMPNMMGIDLLKAVRGDQQLKGIPFLMVTAEAQKDKMLDAAKAGVSSYIIKPFTADVLQAKMEAIFAKP